MSNVLTEEKKQEVLTLGKLGWPLRRIEAATGVRRETAGGYLRAAGIPVAPARRSKPAIDAEAATGSVDSKPAITPWVATDFCGENPGIQLKPGAAESACEPYRDIIELELAAAGTRWRFGRTWSATTTSRRDTPASADSFGVFAVSAKRSLIR
jgi:hypothetical protein